MLGTRAAHAGRLLPIWSQGHHADGRLWSLPRDPCSRLVEGAGDTSANGDRYKPRTGSRFRQAHPDRRLRHRYRHPIATRGSALPSFSANSVTVPAGGSVSFTASISPNAGLADMSLYGGYIKLDERDSDRVYRVPFAGFTGDYQSIVAMPTVDLAPGFSFPTIGADLEGGSFACFRTAWAAPRAGCSLSTTSQVLIHFDHQSRRIEIQVVEAANGKKLHPVFSNIYEEDLSASERDRHGLLRVPVQRHADARQRQWHTGSPEGRAGRPVQDRRQGAEGSRYPEQPRALGDVHIADDHDRPSITGRSSRSPDGGPGNPALRLHCRSRLRRRARTPAQA